jgi:hypothetical protein
MTKQINGLAISKMERLNVLDILMFGHDHKGSLVTRVPIVSSSSMKMTTPQLSFGSIPHQVIIIL